MRELLFIFLALLIQTVSITAQDTLRRENGVTYLGIPLVSAPNTLDGFGSADNGMFGDDYVYTYLEQNDSYNGSDMINSTWMSYGDLLPEKFPDAIETGLGFFPDTFVWNFQEEFLYVVVKDAETTATQDYTFTYEIFEGANPGPIDSLHIVETGGLLQEPSIIQIFPQVFTSTSFLNESANVNLKIIPNPSVGDAKLNYELENNKTVRYKIYSQMGQLIFESELSSKNKGEYSYELPSDLESGIYFIQLEVDRKSIVKKWVKT